MYTVSGFYWDNGYEEEVEELFDTLDDAETCMNYYERCSLVISDTEGNVIKERTAGL